MGTVFSLWDRPSRAQVVLKRFKLVPDRALATRLYENEVAILEAVKKGGGRKHHCLSMIQSFMSEGESQVILS